VIKLKKKFTLKFLGYSIVNTLVLSLANSFFPDAFELGNAYLNAPLAGLFSGFLLTTLLFLARGLARSKYFTVKGRIIMLIYYWGAASAGIWIVARIASVSGFGIARFTWAIGCGFVISLTNWLVRQVYKGLGLI
jgi:uncharacterized membrane protein YvlD (DUF360 family)